MQGYYFPHLCVYIPLVELPQTDLLLKGSRSDKDHKICLILARVLVGHCWAEFQSEKSVTMCMQHLNVGELEGDPVKPRVPVFVSSIQSIRFVVSEVRTVSCVRFQRLSLRQHW